MCGSFFPAGLFIQRMLTLNPALHPYHFRSAPVRGGETLGIVNYFYIYLTAKTHLSSCFKVKTKSCYDKRMVRHKDRGNIFPRLRVGNNAGFIKHPEVTGSEEIK